MGVIGEKLKERGWSRSRLELLGIGVSLLFWITLIWLAWASGTLEGKCKATLLTGERVDYDPENPPNFSEQLVYINYSHENCTWEIICRRQFVCHFEPDYSECWFEPFSLC